MKWTNEVAFDFQVKFDLDDQNQSSPKTIGILTKVFCTSGPNLVILASMGDWHTHWQTHRHTDAGNDNNWRPKLSSGKNGVLDLSRLTSMFKEKNPKTQL